MTTQIKKIRQIKKVSEIVGIATAFKLLADPTRLKIICLLFENADGVCVTDIAEQVGISQSAASHQLAKLEMQGVVFSFREGKTVCYAIFESAETKNLEKVISILMK